MTPAEHYAEAERLLEAARDEEAFLAEQRFDRASIEHDQAVLSGMAIARVTAMAQVHATLATAPFARDLPVVVSAPQVLIDSIKIIDGGPSGILFVPEEMTPSPDPAESVAESLMKAARAKLHGES